MGVAEAGLRSRWASTVLSTQPPPSSRTTGLGIKSAHSVDSSLETGEKYKRNICICIGICHEYSACRIFDPYFQTTEYSYSAVVFITYSANIRPWPNKYILIDIFGGCKTNID
jgi:hypothetical protein